MLCQASYGVAINDIQKRSEIVILLRCAVDAVVDGDESYVIRRKIHFGVLADLKIISAEAGHILYDHTVYLAVVDVGNHSLKARTVEVCATVTVVNILIDHREIVVFCVPLEHLSLRLNLSRVFSP